MNKIVASALAAAASLVIVGCASTSNEPPPVVRSLPPSNAPGAITNYFDATAKRVDPRRELVFGTAQRGSCPMGGTAGGYVGWVVPVEYRTRTSDSATVTVSTYYFWFSDEVIRGVTRRMEVCP